METNTMDTLRARLGAQDHARNLNRRIKQGHTIYLTSPLTGQMAEVTKFRARKACLQGRSARTEKWLSTTLERVHVSA